jgi:DNA-binding XRE family transcriptional regulator
MYDALRKLRKQEDVSAKELAELLELKTKASYYKKENGTVKFSIEEARKIANYFGRNMEEIFLINKS